MLLAALLVTAPPLQDCWPVHRADARRSGFTAQELSEPLVERWRYAGVAPRSAWGEPARGSFWQRLDGLEARVTFDRVHAPVSDGERVLLASSSDDQVRCFDAADGSLRWAHVAGAAVRLAPVLDGGRVLFGADDGTVTALAAEDGALLWRTSLAPARTLIPARGRLASIWPVRTGLVIDGDEVFATAGLFPGQGVFAACLDARTGAVRWRVPLEQGVSPQGYLLLSASRLYVPNGRSTPFVLDRADGRYVGQFGGPGGAWALLANDGELVSGPGNSGELALAGTEARDRLATFAGRRMVVTPHLTYLQTASGVTALDREAHLAALARRDELAGRARAGEDVAAALVAAEAELAACVHWTVATPHTDSLIVAGARVIAGGDGGVVLLDAASGAERWRLTVAGRALALAVAGERLLVSTDRGSLHAFGPGTEGKLGGHRPVSPRPEPRRREEVEHWARLAPRRGFAVLVGVSADEAAHFASSNECSIALVPDPEDAQAARERLAELGLTGRLQVLDSPPGDLPLTDRMANVVVLGGHASGMLEEAQRVVRPYGGAILQDRTVRTSGAPEGAGAWSHAYADAGNVACSRDDLAGGALRLQWYGGPGPRAMIDRHLRTAPPLAVAGTLYLPAFDRVVACDAYNGTVLWEREVPGLSRTGFPFDGGYLAADPQGLWCAVGGAALQLGSDEGRELARVPVPGGGEWGWLALGEGELFGSGQPAGAARKTQSRGEIVDQYRDRRPLVCSRRVFRHDLRHDPAEDELTWTYRGGVIPNTTLAVAGGSVLFLESEAPRTDDVGRATLEELLAGRAALVALDVRTGEERWRVPFEAREEEHVLYLCATSGEVVTVGSYDREGRVWYRVRVFEAATGAERWTAIHPNNRAGTGGDHGEQVHHPVLRGSTLIAEPVAYDLDTGDVVDPTGGGGWSIAARSGCGTLSASNRALFFRDAQPTILDLEPGGGLRKLTHVTRPGCWINVLPAGGLVLLPEASSGCVCAYPVQTSMAFLPVEKR